MAVVDSLCKLPATDMNFISALKSASKAQIQLAITVMKLHEQGPNKTRIAACEKRIREIEDGKPQKNDSPKPKSKSSSPQKKTESECKIVEFPAGKPEIKPLAKSDESHTYEECQQKLIKTQEKYRDEDNQYVIDGLLNRCREDADFRNNFMRKDKTYEGFYQYMFEAARAGYCIQVGDIGGMLEKEKALDLAFDYFNMSEIIEPEEKKKVAEMLTKEVNKIRKEAEKKPEPKPTAEAQKQMEFDF